jgi:putative Mg2+ transporter-C (MgtC) family protein
MPSAGTLSEAVLGLVVAALLGAVIGFQRQYTQRPAGIRTHALVSLGSCAFATYSMLLNDTRIAAGVITGVGFLGAGAIVRQGFTTRGLTTAASIWTAAAIGMGVGLGRASWAAVFIALTILTLLVLITSDELIIGILPRRNRIAIRIVADLNLVTIERVAEEVSQRVVRATFSEELEIERTAEVRRAQIGYIIQLDVRTQLAGLMERLIALDGIERVMVVDEPVTQTT